MTTQPRYRRRRQKSEPPADHAGPLPSPPLSDHLLVALIMLAHTARSDAVSFMYVGAALVLVLTLITLRANRS